MVNARHWTPIALCVLSCAGERPQFARNETDASAEEETSAAESAGASDTGRGTDTAPSGAVTDETSGGVTDETSGITAEELALGEACAEDAECSSGSCADGVCCNTPCDEVCAACNLPGQRGQCAAPVSDTECGELPCRADTDCRIYVSSNSEGSCADAGECNTEATCVPQDQPLGTPCQDAKGSCNDSGECVVAGKLALGVACSDDDECGSNVCLESTDGTSRCCESACDGLCSACDVEGRCAATPNDDPNCEVVTCPEDTSCTMYPAPLTTDRCEGLGVCTTSEDYCQPSHVSEGTECGSGLVCNGQGECGSACSASELWCSGSCIDPMTDGAHCGDCDMQCSEPLVCGGGTCSLTCPGSQLACGTNCVDPMTDAGHCGASADCLGANAGQVCSPPNACQGGDCVLVCSGGQINCDDSCVDPSSSDTYCGASSDCTDQNRGAACADNEACVNGVCHLQCPGAQIPCNGTCIDPATEEAHCGATNDCEGDDAGDVCGSGEQCLLGSCRLPDGDACNAGVECISGICTAFYLDIDGDGYGAESSGLQRVCGAQPPTADYVTNNLDCCDDAADLELAAQANPDFEVPDWPALSIPECSKPFDWNCDGEETPRDPRGGCAQYTSEASCRSSFATSPACGTVSEFHYCFWSDNVCQPGSIEGVLLFCY